MSVDGGVSKSVWPEHVADLGVVLVAALLTSGDWRYKLKCFCAALRPDCEYEMILSRPEKAVYRSATAKCTALWNKASRSTVAAETVEEVVAKKLIVPCNTRWNSFYDALARICEIPIVDLNTISSKFSSKAITEKEHQLLKEYCIAMKPLTVALDILQGEDNCYYGTLLPTLETLMMKTLELKSGLQILVDLPEAIVPLCRYLSLLSCTLFIWLIKHALRRWGPGGGGYGGE
ncbi:hypothetical protein SRHO_G00205680 [Serrasalmus rhombeus]